MKYRLDSSAEGTKQELIEALKRLIKTIEHTEELDGLEAEDHTMITYINESNENDVD